MAEIGAVIDGKYRILAEIGKGGMSTVYLSMDVRLNKQWAVKEVQKRGERGAVNIQSIFDEANLMKKLDHPALPRIVDIIDTPDMLYIIEDYIEGEPLDKVLEKGPQSQEAVIDWVKQICDVLEYLHSRKPPITYRDMKPANVMLNSDGNIKVFDFGAAREEGEYTIRHAKSLGTPGYAAPEQYGNAARVDVRSDIYTVGATMFHLLTGVYPPAKEDLPPIRTMNPELSGGLENIILKCTRADPEERYQSCEELLYALENYEKEDSEYRGRQKKRLKGFGAVAACFLLSTGISAGAKGLSSYENRRSYDNLLNASNLSYEETVERYQEAIKLLPGDIRAYVQLLETYKDDERGGIGISELESQQFSACYSANLNALSQQEQDFLELNFQAGMDHTFSYTGGSEGGDTGDTISFRATILKAYPYFKTICDSPGKESYENTAVAESFCTVGEFYKQYVTNTTGVNEPSREDYTGLLNSLEQCVKNVEDYQDQSASHRKLTVYQELVNLLRSHKKGLAITGVEQELVMNVLDEIKEKCGEIPGTVDETQSFREKLLSEIETVRNDIHVTYENTEARMEKTE